MQPIAYLAYRRLLKSELDVLEDDPINDGNNHLVFGRDRSIVDNLAGPGGLPWVQQGTAGSLFSSFDVAEVPGRYPMQAVPVQVQGGERSGEIKLRKQRHEGLGVWTDPVRATRPRADTAYIFFIRVHSGEIHARYLPNLDDVPAALRFRLAAGPNSGGLAFEEGLVLEDPLLGRIIEALHDKHNVILYGPPGTGKTYLMLKVLEAFEVGIATIVFDPADLAKPFASVDVQLTNQKNRASEFVTFHASTSYETFMVGLRPELTDKGLLNYKVVPGPFLELAENAMKPDSASLLLIDEINRGNTAEIFGELLTVLELDKRLNESRANEPFQTVQVRLPYVPSGNWKTISGSRFQMPWHVFTLGSMNSVDRTVAPLDSAFRRRFRIIEVAPDLSRLRIEAEKTAAALAGTAADEFVELARRAHDLLAAVNNFIAVKRGPDFRLGHSYLWSVLSEDASRSLSDRQDELLKVFSDSMLPQLVELFRDRPEELAGSSNLRGNDTIL